jgi:hypothetical protein
MIENYKKIAIKNDKILELRDKIEELDSKTKYHTGISVRENGFDSSIDEFQELMEKFIDSDMKNITSLEGLFATFKHKLNKNETNVLKMKTEFNVVISERNDIMEEIKNNSETNPCINFVKTSLFNKPHKAIDAFHALREDHPEQVNFYNMQIMDTDFKRNDVRLVVEGNLDTIKDLIRSSKNPKIKYLKTIANSNIKDNFHDHKVFNTVFVNSKLVDLNSFSSDDFILNLAFKNKTSPKIK